MNRELKLVIEQVGREKGIATEVLFEALESALLSASKRTMGVGDNIRLTLDRETGAIRVFAARSAWSRRWPIRSSRSGSTRRGGSSRTRSSRTRSRWTSRCRSSAGSPPRRPSR